MSAITISKNTVTFQRVFSPIAPGDKLQILKWMAESADSTKPYKICFILNIYYTKYYFIIMRLTKVMYIREDLMFYIYECD